MSLLRLRVKTRLPAPINTILAIRSLKETASAGHRSGSQSRHQAALDDREKDNGWNNGDNGPGRDQTPFDLQAVQKRLQPHRQSLSRLALRQNRDKKVVAPRNNKSKEASHYHSGQSHRIQDPKKHSESGTTVDQCCLVQLLRDSVEITG